jgi:chromosome segregation ATPase
LHFAVVLAALVQQQNKAAEVRLQAAQQATQQEREAAAAQLQALKQQYIDITAQLQQAQQQKQAAEARCDAVQQEVDLAKAGLQAAEGVVAAMRDSAAAAATEYHGQLAVQGAQMQELQTSYGKLAEQLASLQTAKKQAEGHAGDWSLLACTCARLHWLPHRMHTQKLSPGRAPQPGSLDQLHSCTVRQHVSRDCVKALSILLLSSCAFADELQRNIDRLASELHATRQEVQQLSEELLALHEHAVMETAQV